MTQRVFTFFCENSVILDLMWLQTTLSFKIVVDNATNTILIWLLSHIRLSSQMFFCRFWQPVLRPSPVFSTFETHVPLFSGPLLCPSYYLTGIRTERWISPRFDCRDRTSVLIVCKNFLRRLNLWYGRRVPKGVDGSSFDTPSPTECFTSIRRREERVGCPDWVVVICFSILP